MLALNNLRMEMERPVGKFLEVVVIKLDPRFKYRIEGIEKFWNIIVKVLNHASNAKPPKSKKS